MCLFLYSNTLPFSEDIFHTSLHPQFNNFNLNNKIWNDPNSRERHKSNGVRISAYKFLWDIIPLISFFTFERAFFFLQLLDVFYSKRKPCICDILSLCHVYHHNISVRKVLIPHLKPNLVKFFLTIWKYLIMPKTYCHYNIIIILFYYKICQILLKMLLHILSSYNSLAIFRDQHTILHYVISVYWILIIANYYWYNKKKLSDLQNILTF